MLPLVQGYVSIQALHVAAGVGDGLPVEFSIISRRSRDRAGGRYERRGIDNDGAVANFAETEQVCS